MKESIKYLCIPFLFLLGITGCAHTVQTINLSDYYRAKVVSSSLSYQQHMDIFVKKGGDFEYLGSTRDPHWSSKFPFGFSGLGSKYIAISKDGQVLVYDHASVLAKGRPDKLSGIYRHVIGKGEKLILNGNEYSVSATSYPKPLPDSILAISRVTENIAEFDEQYVSISGDIRPLILLGSQRIHDAIYRNDIREVTRLINNNKENLEALSYWGMTPIELAIQIGREEIALNLIKLGASYDEQTLYLSSAYDRSSIVNELLNRNIPYARIFDHGNTAFHASLQFWGNNTQYLYKRNRTVKDKIATIKVYLSHGVEINSKDGRGRTLLHIALGSSSVMQSSNLISNIEIIKFLVANQTDANLTDNKGNTPLHYLVSQLNNERMQSVWEDNMLPLLKLIVPEMEDIDSKNKKGLIPLQIAVQNNNIRTAEYLIASGSEANALYIPGKFGQASEELSIQDKINRIKQGEWWNYSIK